MQMLKEEIKFEDIAELFRVQVLARFPHATVLGGSAAPRTPDEASSIE